MAPIKCFLILIVCLKVFTFPVIYEWEDVANKDEESPDYFEGDMLLSEYQMDDILQYRNVLANVSYRWPNGNVPYSLVEDFSIEEMTVIIQAMERIEMVSCVRFKERSNETDYVQFEV